MKKNIQKSVNRLLFLIVLALAQSFTPGLSQGSNANQLLSITGTFNKEWSENFCPQTATYIINGVISGNTITFALPFGVDGIVINTATVSPYAILNVHLPCEFTPGPGPELNVIAQDGSVNSYELVIVNSPVSNQKKMLAFSVRINGMNYPGVIQEFQILNSRVTVVVPSATNVQSLVARFQTSMYCSVFIRDNTGNDTQQCSEITENDFTTPLLYVIRAEDGTEVIYEVRVMKIVPSVVNVLFTADRLTVNAGVAVNFTDQSTGSPNQWQWEFEGAQPGTSALQNPTGIIYNIPGIYWVKLSANNTDNNPGTLTKSNFITVTAPDPPSLIFDLPYFQDFSTISAPPAWTNGITITNYTSVTGWSNPSYLYRNGADAFAFYYSTWVFPHDDQLVPNSRCLGMRPRKSGNTGSYSQPVQILTPGFTLSGADPVVSWFETSWQANNQSSQIHVSNTDVRTVSASKDNITWVPIVSYPDNDIPYSWGNGIKTDYRNMQVHLSQFGFQSGDVVRFKYDLQITSGIYDYWIIDDFYVGGSGYDLKVDGGVHPDFGKILKGYPSEKVFRISNAGGGSITITDVQLLPSAGSQFFTLTNNPAFPVTLKGRLGGSGVAGINIPIKFDPTISGSFNPVLQIDFEVNGQSDSYQYVLRGDGVTCDDAVEIPETDLGTSNTHNYVTEQSSVFYYTATYDQIVQVSSCDPNQNLIDDEYSWDTYLIVTNGCDGTEIAKNDDIEGACQFNRASSAVQFEMTAGETCYIYWPLVYPTALNAYAPFHFSITRTTSPWPDAEFSATSARIIDEGQTVTFANSSSGSPLISGSWEFPGGSPTTWPSLTPPPQVTYSHFGLFNVIHKATNADGSGTLCKVGYILATPLPGSDPYGLFVPTTVSSCQFYLGGNDLLKSTMDGDQNNWIFRDLTRSGMNWEIRKTGVVGCSTSEATMPSTTGSTGYLVLPADEYNCINGVPTVNEVDAYAQSPAFDCSGYDAVIYEFEQRFRYAGAQTIMELQVSKDGGINWKSYNLIEGRGENTTWGDQVIHERINISEVANHQSDVRVRFYWKGSAGYFWMIDDVEVKGYKACVNFSVTIEGTSLVYRGYSPLSTSTLTAKTQSGVGPHAYRWSTGETSPSISVMPLLTTEYSVEVTDVQGCKSTSVFIVAVEDVRCGQKMDKVLMCKKEKNGKGTEICVSPNAVPALLQTGAVLGSCKGKEGFLPGDGHIQELETTMVIYPNPSNGLVTLNLTGLTAGPTRIYVKDLLGRTVRFEEFDNLSTQLLKNLTLESSGVYYIIVETGTVRLTDRFTVIK